MKQNRLVVRAHNSRRPLAKDALRSRYLRCLHDDAALMRCGQLILEETDDYLYDFLEEEWYYPDELLQGWNRYTLLNETARVWAALIAPSKPFADLRLPIHAARTVTADPAALGDSDASLDERLVKHLALLWNADREPDAWTAANCDAVTRFASIGELQRIAGTPGLERVVKASCLLGPFWLRRAQDFHGGTAREWLVHLFVRYPVPAFLYAAVEDSDNELPLKWLVWFLVFAQGGSLRRIARSCGWLIPKRLPGYLPFTAEPMSPAAAIVFAEVRSRGCSEELARCISRHPGYRYDPTEQCGFHHLTTFRQETAIWLAGHAEALTDRDVERVLDWARHRYTEGNRRDQPPFSWRGRQLRPVLAASEQYRHALRSRYENLRWPGHGWDWQFVDENRACWTFAELLSGAALFDDGQAMRHCVGGYGPRCQSGASAIVSILRDGERCLTVEVAPRALRIAQVHGVCNLNPSADERKIVEAWMNAVVRHRRPQARLLGDLQDRRRLGQLQSRFDRGDGVEIPIIVNQHEIVLDRRQRNQTVDRRAHRVTPPAQPGVDQRSRNSAVVDVAGLEHRQAHEPCSQRFEGNGVAGTLQRFPEDRRRNADHLLLAQRLLQRVALRLDPATDEVEQH